MAINLTQPFISPIHRVRPNTTIFATVNVLGGDLIDRIYWQVEDLDGNAVGSGSTVISNDASSDSIRSFSVTISGVTWVANKTYALYVHTQNTTDNVSVNSAWSQSMVFNCYVNPTISLYYVSGGTQVPLTSNTTFSAQPAQIGIVFDKNDIASPAVLSTSQIDVSVGANVVYSATAYGTDPVEIPLAPDTTYKISVTSTMADGALISATALTGITFVPTPATGDIMIYAENDCANGYIKLSCYLSNLTGMPNAQIQRQEQGDTAWITICTETYDDIQYGYFSFIDRLAGSNRIYLYRLVLVATDGSQTISNTSEVLSQFYNAYICNGIQSFKLTNEWTESDNKRVFKSGLYEPYGSKYPIVVNNAILGYDAGTTSAIVLSETTEANKKIDRYGEVILAKRFADFLTDRKPKVLKDFNGNLRIIAIQSNVSRNYVKELGNGICSTSFSWVEISDFSQANIGKIGLLGAAKADARPFSITLDVDERLTIQNTATTAAYNSTYSNEISGAYLLDPATLVMSAPGQTPVIMTIDPATYAGVSHITVPPMTVKGDITLTVKTYQAN